MPADVGDSSLKDENPDIPDFIRTFSGPEEFVVSSSLNDMACRTSPDVITDSKKDAVSSSVNNHSETDDSSSEEIFFPGRFKKVVRRRLPNFKTGKIIKTIRPKLDSPSTSSESADDSSDDHDNHNCPDEHSYSNKNNPVIETVPLQMDTDFDIENINFTSKNDDSIGTATNATPAVTGVADMPDDEFLLQFPQIDVNEGSTVKKNVKKNKHKTIAEYALPDTAGPSKTSYENNDIIPSTSKGHTLKRVLVYDENSENKNPKKFKHDCNESLMNKSSSLEPKRSPLAIKHNISSMSGNRQKIEDSQSSDSSSESSDDENDFKNLGVTCNDKNSDSDDTSNEGSENNLNFFHKNVEDMPFPNIEESINFDIGRLLKRPTMNHGNRVMGDKGAADYHREKLLTTKCIERLYTSITKMPKDAVEQDPQGLRVPLMSHQRQSLKWMKWRERQDPSGGILADDMGLGKTLQLIALVLATKNEKKEKERLEGRVVEDSSDSGSEDELVVRSNQRKTFEGKTLVVCPPSLIDQWEREIRHKTKKNVLKCYVYHGNSRSISEGRLAKYDIVITSYHLLTKEYEQHVSPKIYKDSRLYKIIWERVILDEAHMIRNDKGKMNEAASEVRTRSRWALTGTPIQNKETDMYALLKFLNCTPFNERQVWKKWVSTDPAMGGQRLVVITKSLMLRRTKDELMRKGMIQKLPEKKVEEIKLDLDLEEKIVYQKLLLYSQTFFLEFLRQRKDKEYFKQHGFHMRSKSLITEEVPKNMTKLMKTLVRNHKQIHPHFILVLILRLRQMCCHPTLIKSMLDKEDVELAGGDNEADFLNVTMVDEINKVLAEEGEDEEPENSLTIDDDLAQNVMSRTNPVFRDDRQSSKVRAILKIVQQVIDNEEKIIIVSQWTGFLDIIANFLKDIDGAYYGRFTGQVPVRERQLIVDKLNDRQNKFNVLLLSLTCGGVGLNLVGANNLMIIDMHWNPQLETQAQDRIYRFGQENNVKIWKFICKDTIEEKIKTLQNKKLKLASNILTGKVSNKLTIEDLKLLFS